MQEDIYVSFGGAAGYVTISSHFYKMLLFAPEQLLPAPEPKWSCSGAAPPILPSDLVTLGVLLRSSSTLAPLTSKFTRGKLTATEQMEEHPS